VGAAALAAGIAFGLGGREVAAEIARDWYERNRPHRPARKTEPTPPPAAAPPFPLSPPSDTRS
jgi:hypothetical protein